MIFDVYVLMNIHVDQSPVSLTSDNFIRSNEFIRTKWPIY